MALVRVKRRAQDDPIDVLLLACKKQKTDPIGQVFRFAATVPTEADDVKTHLSEATKGYELPYKYKPKDVAAITKKLREESKWLAESNRLKIVNCFRALESDSVVEDSVKPLTVVDIENTIREEPKDSNSSEGPLTEEQYVYDLYLASNRNNEDFDDLMMQNVLSAHVVDEQLLFGDYAEDSEDEANDDEDDSNDENNWRNDYPDEECSFGSRSIDEDDMRQAMEVINTYDPDNPESDLSSDGYDEGLVYDDGVPRYNSVTCGDLEEEDTDDEDMIYGDAPRYKSVTCSDLEEEDSDDEDSVYSDVPRSSSVTCGELKEEEEDTDEDDPKYEENPNTRRYFNRICHDFEEDLSIYSDSENVC